MSTFLVPTPIFHITAIDNLASTKPSEITIVGSALSDADAFLRSHEDRETAERVERISRLIEGFETPYGMELLATVHWAAASESRLDRDEIVRRVHAWNARKRSIMKPGHITVAYDRLVAEDWLSAA